jgi:MOSC domain-containing protein YiiM
VALVESVNVGVARSVLKNGNLTGIDKQPISGSVHIAAPGPKGIGGSGVAGDVIGDLRHHGGDDQAVYCYAREDLDWWALEIGESLRSGMFGENLTLSGLDVTSALVGEKWRVGDDVLLQVTAPRIPCATFATWMAQRGWLKRFTQRAHPGAYLRVLVPGEVVAGARIEVEWKPRHEVSIGLMFRALTLERALLPQLLDAEEFLEPELVRRARMDEPYEVAEDAASEGADSPK